MTISAEEARAEAERLDEAERTRAQIRRTTLRHPGLTIDDAYVIQAAWRDLRLGRGEQLIGHKIGLTSRAMQQAMNITTPDSGFLTDAMRLEAVDGRISFAADEHLDPKLEVELAFVLGRDLDASSGEITIDTVLDATDHVVPALELIAARSFRVDPETGTTRTVIDTIADNAADAGVLVGGERVGPRDVDLRWVAALLSRNDVVEETGVAAGVLGHPAEGIVWLARRYAEQGLRLRAGQLVLAGSFTRPVDVRGGDRFRADYGPLGCFEIEVT